MSRSLERFTSENEATYDSLISLIENTQDRLSLIVVACDDLRLRQRVVERYEAEARSAKIRSSRVMLGTEPSLRSGLAKLNLQSGDRAVVTVTGAEWLLRVKMREEEAQSDLDKFFGYLQWTREGLREFHYPIVLWVTHRILREMSRKAPDFWSWRKAVLRFASEEVEEVPVRDDTIRQQFQTQPDQEFLPPLEELLSEIEQLESTSPESANLATLYDKLGQVYANRIANGEAKNLEQERQRSINAFQNAIHRYETLNNQSDLVGVFVRFGNFLCGQSCYEDAIAAYQQSLTIAREIGDRRGEANSLRSLGDAYSSLGQYQRAIDFHQQSLEIKREIGDRNGEGGSLCNLGSAYNLLGQYQRAIEYYQQALVVQREVGNRDFESNSLVGLGSAYNSLGQYQRAIDFHQQSLEIKREIGDRRGEAFSLGGLGSAYNSLGQYQRAIDFHQQSLGIGREIGDRHGEAISLHRKALALAKYEPRRFEALATLQQAREIYAELKLDYRVAECDATIYAFNQIIATKQPQSAPAIPAKAKVRATSKRKINWVLWVCVGSSIVLLIAWLRK
ncbi:MAG: tetratricopeptide repeat protein [Phormidium tanganyikae FI6-MK23]|jgi:tetratricopeptide (TPR) repeat protein|nr:tetratricopeptide repeat protein [Phormidium tanganyikae FI6-MK23]